MAVALVNHGAEEGDLGRGSETRPASPWKEGCWGGSVRGLEAPPSSGQLQRVKARGATLPPAWNSQLARGCTSYTFSCGPRPSESSRPTVGASGAQRLGVCCPGFPLPGVPTVQSPHCLRPLLASIPADQGPHYWGRSLLLGVSDVWGTHCLGSPLSRVPATQGPHAWHPSRSRASPRTLWPWDPDCPLCPGLRCPLSPGGGGGEPPTGPGKAASSSH